MPDSNEFWRFHKSVKVSERSVDELIGLCRGLLADGLLVQSEAEFLLQWMKANQAQCMGWPMNMMYGRISAMLEDGVLDESEQSELIELLGKFVGGGLLPEGVAESGLVVSRSTSLPLDEPAPEVVFAGKAFCFTGEMCFGPRKSCESLVLDLGGSVRSSVSKSLNYLVVGHVGSLAWVHSTYGRKIQGALDLREQGLGLSIIGEDHWVRSARVLVPERVL